MRRKLRLPAAGLVLALILAGWAAPGAAGARDPGDGVVSPANFDNASYDDVAIGAPGEDIGAVADAGAVTAVYPNQQRPAQTFRQGAGGVAGAAEVGDRFGSALAIGQFNDDSYDDLAVGVPGEDVGGAVDAGAVNMIEGTEAGLRPGALYLQGRPEPGDRFGAALTLNGFLGDGGDDLAVGAPGETVGAVASSGPVEAGDAFGTSLGWYTVHPGGFLLTLVVGAPGRNRFGADAGAVFPCYAYPGQGVLCDQHRLQDEGAGAEAGDRYGAAVSGGSYHTSDRNFFDGDGLEDVVVGAPGETVGSARGAGAATIVFGDQYFENVRKLWQGHAGVGGTPEPGDAFGAAVA